MFFYSNSLLFAYYLGNYLLRTKFGINIKHNENTRPIVAQTLP